LWQKAEKQRKDKEFAAQQATNEKRRREEVCYNTYVFVLE